MTRQGATSRQVTYYTTTEGTLVSRVVSTATATRTVHVWPTDRHSTAFLRDESCRLRMQALIWQTYGRPDAPAECVFREIGGLVGVRG
jgi:hypothetical protein